MPLSASLPKISTNVRFAAGALLAPDFAEAWAERLFLTPPRTADGASSAIDLIDARSRFIEHRGRLLATWHWGKADAPAVVLAHGWGGHAAQLRAFAFPLLQAGYRVVTFDQPAHGVSEGRLTALPDFADVLTAVAASHGGVRAVIAHSLGAMAAALALARGWPLERVVLISPPSDLVGYSRHFARFHWIPEAVRDAMQAAVEERYGVRWAELELARLAPKLNTPALVIHDRDDRVVPWSQGAGFALSWRGARFMTTHGLGHTRILRDDTVTQAAATFIREG
jgi:pimeloyl-ACP methyl ester carboxylesterase